MKFLQRFALVLCGFAFAGCGGSSSSPSAVPPAAPASVRFADGAPLLKTLISGVPGDIGPAYLQVNGATVASSFNYGTLTPFVNVSAGTLSLVARDELGYAVGPLKSTALSPAKRYTLIVVGTYPKYRVLTFAEPANGAEAQLSLYEASPAMPQAAFGRFRASTDSDFKQIGSAHLGEVSTVMLGKSVSDFGAYAGNVSEPIGTFTLEQIDAFDSHNVLPFHAATRFSLFLFDAKSDTSIGPLFGSLDR
jgi:hypothetical protein